MKRTTERRVLYLAAIWNILTAMFTIIGYSTWFKHEGVTRLQANNQYSYLNSSMLDSVTSVIMLFGLFMLVIGVINIFVARTMQNDFINTKVMVWLSICTLIQFLSFDILGIFLYLVATILYFARNKAIKLHKKTVR